MKAKPLPVPDAARLFFLAALLVSVCSCGEQRREQPVAIDGVLELGDWDFEKDGSVALKGQWHFVWQEFVEPSGTLEFREKLSSVVDVPSSWHTLNNPQKPDEVLPGRGYATYVLEVRLPKGLAGDELALASAHQGSATKWQAVKAGSGEVLALAEQGVIGKSHESSVPVWVPTAMDFEVGASESILIWLQISNFTDPRGGVWNAPSFGRKSDVLAEKSSKLILNVVVFGICLIIALYHLILFYQRQEDYSSGFFAIFCASVALRQWCTGQCFQELGVGHSKAGFEILATLEMTTMPLMSMTVTLFVHSLIPHPLFRRFTMSFAVIIGLILVAFTCMVPVSVAAEYLSIYQMHVGGVVLVITGHLISSSFKGDKLARWVLLAFGMIFLGVANDLLVVLGVISTMFIGPHTVMAFVLLKAGILAQRNAAIARERDLLNGITIEALKKSEEAARVKSEFLANMSHELRTPLNGLCNIPPALLTHFSEKLLWECPSCKAQFEDDEPPEDPNATEPCPECPDMLMTMVPKMHYGGNGPEDYRLIKLVDEQAQELLGLVERVLSFDEANKGIQALELQTVPSQGLFADLFKESIAKGNKRQQELDIVMEIGVEELLIDLEKAEKCVDMVLDNAFKFSPEGTEVRCLVESDSAERLTVKISDQGIGIEQSEIEKIFTPFYQVESSHTRDYGGAGLGLALAQEIAVLHHGSIQVESQPGAGSTFILKFRSGNS